MKKTSVIVLSSMLVSSLTLCTYAAAEDPTPWYENEQAVPYPDNTQALQNSTDNSVDILGSGSDDKLLALQGEIMLKVREDITEVYSNGNLVEQIIKGVGSTGVVTGLEESVLRFTPTGRPELTCTAKENGWYGPCRVEQAADEG